MYQATLLLNPETAYKCHISKCYASAESPIAH